MKSRGRKKNLKLWLESRKKNLTGIRTHPLRKKCRKKKRTDPESWSQTSKKSKNDNWLNRHQLRNWDFCILHLNATFSLNFAKNSIILFFLSQVHPQVFNKHFKSSNNGLNWSLSFSVTYVFKSFVTPAWLGERFRDGATRSSEAENYLLTMAMTCGGGSCWWRGCCALLLLLLLLWPGQP